MATKVFSKALMASEDVQSYVGSCKMYDDDTAIAVADGSFVNIQGLDFDGVYGASSYDYNVHVATAPDSDHLTREDICVIDVANIEEWTKGPDVIKFGNRLVNLEGPADYAVRFRRLMKGDKFWIGAGNFKTVPTIGKYATVEADSVLLAPNNNITSAQMNVQILASKALTVGQTVTSAGASAWEQLYLVEVL